MLLIVMSPLRCCDGWRDKCLAVWRLSRIVHWRVICF